MGYTWEVFSHKSTATAAGSTRMKRPTIAINALDRWTTRTLLSESEGVVSQVARNLGKSVENIIERPPHPNDVELMMFPQSLLEKMFLMVKEGQAHLSKPLSEIKFYGAEHMRSYIDVVMVSKMFNSCVTVLLGDEGRTRDVYVDFDCWLSVCETQKAFDVLTI